LGYAIRFAQKGQVENSKKTHLSQARALLFPEGASLVEIWFWNRTYLRVRLWSRNGSKTVICFSRGGGKCRDRKAFG